MSGLLRPRNLMIGGALLGGMYFTGLPFNIFNTPGTQNIGNRWASAGGSNTHTPAIATPRGNANNVSPNQANPGGIDSPHFKENVANQRPGDPGPFDKQWNNAHYGTEKGK